MINTCKNIFGKLFVRSSKLRRMAWREIKTFPERIKTHNKVSFMTFALPLSLIIQINTHSIRFIQILLRSISDRVLWFVVKMTVMNGDYKRMLHKRKETDSTHSWNHIPFFKPHEFSRAVNLERQLPFFRVYRDQNRKSPDSLYLQ